MPTDDSFSPSQPSKLINCLLLRADISDSFIGGLLIQSSDLTEADLRGSEVMIIEPNGGCLTETVDDTIIRAFKQNNVILHRAIVDGGRVGSNLTVE